MPPRARAAVGEATPTTGQLIQLERLKRARIEVDVVGRSPLIPHRWSQKALQMMRNKQFGLPATRPEPKNPQEEAEQATYWLDEAHTRPGMPATAFKAAMADSARYFNGLTIVGLKRALFVEGEGDDQLVEVFGELTMREDTPRNATGVADLRYRNMIWPWRARLTVVYLESMITAESVVAVVDAAGNSGVGDWRPSSPKSNSGTFGTFEVAG